MLLNEENYNTSENLGMSEVLMHTVLNPAEFYMIKRNLVT